MCVCVCVCVCVRVCVCVFAGYHPPVPTPRAIVAARAELSEELSHQRSLVAVAAAKRGPKENWQVRLLRTLPPDRAADMVYGKGMSWLEERERRRGERSAHLMSFLEDVQRPLMILDGDPPLPPLT